MNAKAVVEGEDAAVEEFVMEGAKAKSVDHNIGAASLMPLDVSRFEGDGAAFEQHLKTTHGALVVVSFEDAFAKSGVAGAPFGCRVPCLRLRRIDIQSNSIENILVDGFGKMGVEQVFGQFPQLCGVVAQLLVNGFREAAEDVFVAEERFVGGAQFPEYLLGFFIGRGEFPYPVILEVVKRELGLVAFRIRPEFGQQVFQRLFDLRKRQQPRLPRLDISQRQQDQQRLVRRPFTFIDGLVEGGEEGEHGF